MSTENVIRMQRNPLAARSGAIDENLRQEAVLLQWLGQETLSFNRSYVDVTGNVLSALWLSYVVDRIPTYLREGTGSAAGDAFSFAMTGQECEAATGISRAQQVTVRRQLAEAGLLNESGSRGKAVLYTVHLDRLRTRLQDTAQPLMDALQAQAKAEPAARHGTR